MAFSEIKLPDGSAEITFLYRLRAGLAEASFGVWCARLAGLPKSVLTNAQERADGLKKDTEEKRRQALEGQVRDLLGELRDGEGALQTARTLYRALRLARV